MPISRLSYVDHSCLGVVPQLFSQGALVEASVGVTNVIVVVRLTGEADAILEDVDLVLELEDELELELELEVVEVVDDRPDEELAT